MTSPISLPEASLHAIDGSVDRLYTKSFSFLVRLSLYLTNVGILLVPFGSTAKAEWDQVKQGVIAAEQNALSGADIQAELDALQAEIAG